MAKATRKLNLRSLLLFLILFLVLVVLGYKPFEYKTLQSLTKLHTETVTKELSLVEEGERQNEEAIALFVEILTDSTSTIEKLVPKYDELEGMTTVGIHSSDEYLNTIKQHKDQYRNLRWRTLLLFGKEGVFARKFVDNLNEYYDLQIESSKENHVGLYLFLNLVEVMEDKSILADVERKSGSDLSNYSKHFGDLATLEKYTRNDYKFKEEDKIKELYSYGYEHLNKNREYLATYYKVVEDVFLDDIESANYKLPRLNLLGAELNLDIDRLFSEAEERNINRDKSTFEVAKNNVKGIKDFKTKKLGTYPFFGKVEGWKEDLEMCQLYEFKAGLFNSISKLFPKAKTFDELLKELATVPPKSDEVDGLFDKSVIEFNNTDEALIFKCTDKETGKVYLFKLTK